MAVEAASDSEKAGHARHAPASTWFLLGWYVLATHSIRLAALHQCPRGHVLCTCCVDVEICTSCATVMLTPSAAARPRPPPELSRVS